jgi:hypothetical protein
VKIVIFGLSISSSWGNGHATLWRGLCRALHAMGHRVVFFERDMPYYANHRDLHKLDGGELALYSEWSDGAARAQDVLADANAAMVTSFCPDGIAASGLLFESRVPFRVFMTSTCRSRSPGLPRANTCPGSATGVCGISIWF